MFTQFDIFTGFDRNFAEAERAFDSVMKKVEAIKKETENMPMNNIFEEDGSNTIEVAIPGKTREDVKVKGITKEGVNYIIIEVTEPELTEEQKAAEEKRQYYTHKMKSGKLYKELPIDPSLDIKGTTVSVENGLLTIKIPVAEEAKPMEFEIQ